MKTIQINDTSYLMPGCWNELTLRELEKLVCLLSHKYAPTIYVNFLFFCLLERKAKAVRQEYLKLERLSCLKKGKLKDLYLQEFDNFKSELLIHGEELFGWIFEGVGLTKQFYPLLLNKYKSFENLPYEITYKEYARGEILIKQFYESKDSAEKDQLLTDLLCTVYAKYEEGERCQISFENTESVNAKRNDLREIPSYIKWANMFFLSSNINLITQQFPSVFAPTEYEEPMNANPYGHISIMLELAGTKFGTLREVENTNLMTILIYLSNEHEKYKKIQEQYDK